MTNDNVINETTKKIILDIKKYIEGSAEEYVNKWSKVTNNLFSKDSLTQKELKRIMKKYFDPNKVAADSVTAFNTDYTWGDILRAFGTNASMTKTDFFVEILTLAKNKAIHSISKYVF